MPRKYELRTRAETQAETRRRIVDATFRLHASIGPARTTVTKIAETAGVERLTVYKHFPEMSELFKACAAHGLGFYPLPQPELWRRAAGPEARLGAGLAETYGYYRRNEQMMRVILRDRDAGQPSGARFVGFMEEAATVLAEGWPETPAVRAAIGHAVDFQAWRSLAFKQGLDDELAVRLMLGLVKTSAAPPS